MLHTLPLQAAWLLGFRTAPSSAQQTISSAVVIGGFLLVTH
jgi:hypothetical protein